MFYILDGREHFYQWDLDRKLVVEDKTINKVYFCNRTKNCSVSRCVYDVNGTRLVDVPNTILQDSFRMYVYGYDSNYTKYDASFDIKARSKPEDYIYTEEEQNAWEDLEQRITEIEENGVSEETVAAAVENYLVENPIEAGATAAQAAQIEANTQAIEELKKGGGGSPSVDLTNYYTKGETDAAIAADNPRYVVKATQNAATEEITFDKTFEDINTAYNDGKEVVLTYSGRTYEISKAFTSSFVFLWMNYDGWDEIKITNSNVITNDYGFFITDKAMENKLSGYAKETYVDNALKSYAKTTDIPDVSGYQTAAQVQTAIENYVGVIENGSY